MASRQMAFQLSALEYREALKLFFTLGDAPNIKAYLAAVPDEKRRNRLSAALQVATACSQAGTDHMRVRKIVCWRDDEGKPGVVKTSFWEE